MLIKNDDIKNKIIWLILDSIPNNKDNNTNDKEIEIIFSKEKFNEFLNKELSDFFNTKFFKFNAIVLIEFIVVGYIIYYKGFNSFEKWENKFCYLFCDIYKNSSEKSKISIYEYSQKIKPFLKSVWSFISNFENEENKFNKDYAYLAIILSAFAFVKDFNQRELREFIIDNGIILDKNFKNYYDAADIAIKYHPIISDFRILQADNFLSIDKMVSVFEWPEYLINELNNETLISKWKYILEIKDRETRNNYKQKIYEEIKLNFGENRARLLTRLYIEIGPLLAENKAISKLAKKFPEVRLFSPKISTIDDAIEFAKIRTILQEDKWKKPFVFQLNISGKEMNRTDSNLFKAWIDYKQDIISENQSKNRFHISIDDLDL